jgi:21S rRNA (GM2251-2'-O)-methyltransferase
MASLGVSAVKRRLASAASVTRHEGATAFFHAVSHQSPRQLSPRFLQSSRRCSADANAVEVGKSSRKRSKARRSTTQRPLSSWDDFEPFDSFGDIDSSSSAPSDNGPRVSLRDDRDNSSRRLSFSSQRRDGSRNNDRSRPGGRYQDFDKSRRFRNENAAPRDGHRRPDFQPRHGQDSGRNLDRRRFDNNPRAATNPRPWQQPGRTGDAVKPAGRIDMRALDEAGFVHLYGMSSVLNALRANRRQFVDQIDIRNGESESSDLIFLDPGDGVDEEFSDAYSKAPEIKAEAQLRPYLFCQEQPSGGERSADKSNQALQIRMLATQRGIPVAHVDKGVLNTLSGNRPHQGFVLRCGSLTWEPLSRIPLLSVVDHDSSKDRSSLVSIGPKKLWLVLDEIVDPQNLGALLRTAYFLGGSSKDRPEASSDDTENRQATSQAQIGVIVCAKNSAPPSPVVSTASAGALEVMDVYVTSNLPRLLQSAQLDGFRIIGASSSIPSNDASLFDLSSLPKASVDTGSGVILVLGSEGHGLRTLVAQQCTEFVRIPGGGVPSSSEDPATETGSVDSLNVSVTGGILLWHLLQQT